MASDSRALDPSPWLKALLSENAAERKAATLALGGVDSETRVDVSPLLDALGSADENTRFWSVVALGRLEKQSEVALGGLIALAGSDPAFGLRQAAVSAISQIAIDAQHVREALFAALADPSEFVRRESLQAIAKLSRLSEREVALVQGLEGDPSDTVVNWTRIALRRHLASKT